MSKNSSTKRKNDDSGICIRIDLSDYVNLLDIDVSRITLGDYTKGEYGGTVPINYNNSPLKFILCDPQCKTLESYEMDAAKHNFFLTSRYGISRFEANESSTAGQKQPHDRYNVGLCLYGAGGPSEYHAAVTQKLDDVRERICTILKDRPQLFRKPSIEMALVKNVVPSIYEHPKKDVNGTRIPDENSPNKTIYMKILHYPPKDGRPLGVRDFKSKLYNLGDMGTVTRKKRGSNCSLQESMPVDTEGQMKFNSSLGIHACVVDINSLYISQSSQFYWRRHVDKLFFQETENHMSIQIIRGLDTDEESDDSSNEPLIRTVSWE